jgi:outer membrane protein OmpA-like peptidoglycan-associated protein
MIRVLGRTLALALALAVLPGCCWLWKPSGPETLVVVVPSRHDGHVGAVVVAKGEERQVLDSAYATARVKSRGHVHRTSLSAEEVQRKFAQASAALPRKSMAFTLHFVLANQTLTPESSARLDQVLAEAANWEAAEIDVVGHTDRMGTPENNDALSLKRAEHVRRLLIDKGAKPEAVTAIGMGERQPVIETADGEAEAANRRVEVIVR